MLTELKLRSLKSRIKLYRVADGAGLSIEVPPGGVRRFRYRFAGAPKMLSLSVYPEVSLAEARLKCEQTRAQLCAGIDSAAARKQGREAALVRRRTRLRRSRGNG
jgi:hypothetical protein